jgi:hypothetical protein
VFRVVTSAIRGFHDLVCGYFTAARTVNGGSGGAGKKRFVYFKELRRTLPVETGKITENLNRCRHFTIGIQTQYHSNASYFCKESSGAFDVAVVVALI